jgi:hypothetical protein
MCASLHYLLEIEFSAAQYSVAAIGAGGKTQTTLQLHKNFENRSSIAELLIRYEDIIGNTYATEYRRFEETNEWYTWALALAGENWGCPVLRSVPKILRPRGVKGRIYYDGTKGLF